MIIEDGYLYGYDPGLGGFFKKVKKGISKVVKKAAAPVRAVKKPIVKLPGIKQAHKFSSRAWKNPLVKGAVLSVVTAGAGAVLAPAMGVSAVNAARAAKLVKGVKAVKAGRGLVKGVKTYKRSKRAVKAASAAGAGAVTAATVTELLPGLMPAEAAKLTPSQIYQRLAANPAFTAMNEDRQAEVLELATRPAGVASQSLAPESADASAPDAEFKPASATASALSNPYLIAGAVAAGLYLLTSRKA